MRYNSPRVAKLESVVDVTGKPVRFAKSAYEDTNIAVFCSVDGTIKVASNAVPNNVEVCVFGTLVMMDTLAAWPPIVMVGVVTASFAITVTMSFVPSFTREGAYALSEDIETVLHVGAAKSVG